MTSKLLFLDIDGVLVTKQCTQITESGFMVPDPECIATLNKITKATGAKIVISSTWRLYHPRFLDLPAFLKEHGVTGEIIGMTPEIKEEPVTLNGKEYSPVTRGQEIAHWCTLNKLGTETCFIILDDDGDMDLLMNRLVQTDFDSGLQQSHAEQAIAMLGANHVG